MRLIDRYIGSTVAANTAIVGLVLLSLYFFTALVDEMGDVGKGSYTAWDAIQYTVVLMPRLAYELFPLTALLGSMLGLGSLATTSELTVIRATGVSLWRVVVSVLKIGLVMMAIVTILGEVVAPPAEKYGRIERAKALAAQISVNTDFGLWAREGDTFINIRRLLPSGVFTELSLYRLTDDGRLRDMLNAGKGEYLRDGKWRLRDVKRTIVGDEEVRVETRETDTWQSSLTPDVFEVVSMDPEKLSVFDLLGYIRHLRDNELDASRYRVAFWNRLMIPFATAGMVLMAVPFVFGSLRSVGVGQRIMVGALLGIGFYLFNAVFTRFGLVYGLSPFLSAVAPTLTVYLLWFWLMRRVR